MKTKEELLSEEVRSAMDMGSRLLQWGVTLMISVQTALFFVRHEVVTSLIDGGALPKGSILPRDRYAIGTCILAYLAFVLSKLNARASEQYRHYKTQLIATRTSGISDLPIKHTGRWVYFIYFSFPAIDILVRIAVSISIKLQ